MAQQTNQRKNDVDRSMTSFTPEPWSVKETSIPGYALLQAGTLKGNFASVSVQLPTADAQRAVDCVNGCAGLNPAAYRAVVEALKNTRAFLKGQINGKRFRPDDIDAAEHGLREVQSALTLAEQP